VSAVQAAGTVDVITRNRTVLNWQLGTGNWLLQFRRLQKIVVSRRIQRDALHPLRVH
jgi:hypothetical protein